MRSRSALSIALGQVVRDLLSENRGRRTGPCSGPSDRTNLSLFRTELLLRLAMPDPFECFARECELHLTVERLCVAPRDVLASLSRVEQHSLVELTRQGSDAAPVRLVFVAPVMDAQAPTVRDVLWWVAGDAWALERGERRIEPWSATYGYPLEEEATSRLFNQCIQQATALARLLGELDYCRLLALYESELAPPHVQ